MDEQVKLLATGSSDLVSYLRMISLRPSASLIRLPTQRMLLGIPSIENCLRCYVEPIAVLMPPTNLLYSHRYGLVHTILADAISGFTNFFGLLKHSENPTFKYCVVGTPLQAF